MRDGKLENLVCSMARAGATYGSIYVAARKRLGKSPTRSTIERILQSNGIALKKGIPRKKKNDPWWGLGQDLYRTISRLLDLGFSPYVIQVQLAAQGKSVHRNKISRIRDAINQSRAAAGLQLVTVDKSLRAPFVSNPSVVRER